MRVGIFTDTYPPFINGVSTSIAMLESALKKLGHEVFIVTVNPEAMSYVLENDGKIIRLPGIPLNIYDYRFTGIYSIKAVNQIKSWDLDIIHSHTEFGVGIFARIMAKQLDIPIVHTYHTMYEDYIHYVTKGYFDGPSKKILEYLTKFYCDKTVTELIVPTRKAYDLFKKKYEYNRNVHIVPTGIEVEHFYKENVNNDMVEDLKKKYKIKKEDFLILFVGRLAEEKNVTFLIDNHKKLLQKNKNYKLMIIGYGPDEDKLKKYVDEQGLSKNIIFTGKISWDIINNYYQLATIFVSASHSETQGLTLLEAMAAGKPVVVCNDDAFTDVVVEDLNGHLFNDENEYIEKIELLRKDKKKYSRMCRQARINGEAHSSKYYGEKVLDVYYTALGGKPTGERAKRTFSSRMKNVIRKGFHGDK